MATQTATRKTRTIQVRVRNKKRKLVIQREERSAFDKKAGITTFKLLTDTKEPIGAVLLHDDGTVSVQRASRRSDPKEFALNHREHHRRSPQAALNLAVKWYDRFH